MHVLMQRVDPDVPLPRYQTPEAAGMDIHAAIPEPLTLAPGEILHVPCGFRMALDAGYEAQIRPRSGLASRHGVTLPNAPGTIDSDYRGEVIVPLINLGREPFVIERHMRIAQMIIAPIVQASVTEASALPPSHRGERGFGSTGLR